MTCSRCGRENQEDASHCVQCGEPLQPAPVGTARLSGLAVASLVLGLVGVLGGLTSLPGLVLGVVALNRINRSRGELRGAGLAAAGLVISVFTLLFAPAVFAPMLLKARAARHERACRANLVALTRAARDYAGQHEGFLPGPGWCDELERYLPREKLACPTSHQAAGYAMNQAAVGRKLDQLPKDTVIFFESDRGWNAVGDPDQDGPPARHLDRNLAIRADGRVVSVAAPTSFG